MFCNHLPGILCPICYTLTPDANSESATVASRLYYCGACGCLSTGNGCDKCATKAASPLQPAYVLDEVFAKEIKSLRDDLEDVRADIKYILSVVTPAGGRRRKARN